MSTFCKLNSNYESKLEITYLKSDFPFHLECSHFVRRQGQNAAIDCNDITSAPSKNSNSNRLRKEIDFSDQTLYFSKKKQQTNKERKSCQVAEKKKSKAFEILMLEVISNTYLETIWYREASAGGGGENIWRLQITTNCLVESSV